MLSNMNWHIILADLIVILHLAFVSFVVLGMAAILVGLALHRRWARNFYFRAMHLLCILVVVVESLCGIVCPLTDWENRLRMAGGGEPQGDWFVIRWAQDLLFVELTPEEMRVWYVAFAAAVILTFVLAPPRGLFSCRGDKKVVE
jgi:hypothetical protein